MYFTDDTENAIVEYNSCVDERVKNRLFNERIYFPFYKIAVNLINTFKFSYFEDSIDDVTNDVVSYMVEKMHTYDQDRGKAFGYFSVTAKNYLIHLNNGNHKSFKKTEIMSNMPEGWDVVSSGFHDAQNVIEYSEFNKMIVKFWDENLNKIFFNKRDVQIADSIVELFRQSPNIENFNKKHLYLLVREMGDHRTHYITKIVQQMKPYQQKLLNDYQDTGNVTYDLNDYHIDNLECEFFQK